MKTIRTSPVRGNVRKEKPQNRIREMRMKAGLTQQQLAERSGVSRVTIAKLEKQMYKPQINTVNSLSQVLCCDPDVLSGRKKLSEWNSTDLKLPDDSDYYVGAMVVKVGRSKLRSYAVVWFNKGKSQWMETKIDGSITGRELDVSAWTPLPDDPW